jgi:hypothetical protein
MRIWPPAVYDWGSTAAERDETFPCDRLVADADAALFRAVEVRAGAAVVFRWLCQLREAPYSYDRLDNGGRMSPQTLTPGLEQLREGQRMMRIFRLVSFEPGRSITVLSEGSVFNRVACTYRVLESSPEHSRLVVKLLIAYPRRPLLGAAMRLVLPAGDLVMMRRQLLNLKALAERQSERDASS